MGPEERLVRSRTPRAEYPVVRPEAEPTPPVVAIVETAVDPMGTQ